MILLTHGNRAHGLAGVEFIEHIEAVCPDCGATWMTPGRPTPDRPFRCLNCRAKHAADRQRAYLRRMREARRG